MKQDEVQLTLANTVAYQQECATVSQPYHDPRISMP